jgi:beta-aspartyl-peptidase (threonine type)
LCVFYISEGGIPGKLKGRIGDAPLVGCGGYANKHGAATVGGHGEAIMKMTLAREVVYNIEKGENAQVRL